jgi:two-component system, sensor histidine kinase and response regulator
VARIVLIDDEAALRAVMGEILAGAGHETVGAANGEEGLAAVRRERPDVVLCDINMPVLDGFGVLRAIRTDPQLAALPFVFLTSESEVRAGMLSGADDYLMKPVSAKDLLAAIDARLAREETTRREAERRLDEMRHAVAVLLPHELRTPLTTIIGSARLLQELHGDLEGKEIEEMASGILEAAQRLHRMAENYILYADLEVRRLSAGSGGEQGLGSSGPLEVESAAKETATQSGRSADLELLVHDVAVPMGPAYLRKAVTELTDNAFRFSPPGTAVRVLLEAADGAAVLQVVDQGRGMTAAQSREVGAFQQFDRGRFEQQGSGVGLALVRSIAEATGGRLEIVSRPAEGTTVRIRWPGRAV